MAGKIAKAAETAPVVASGKATLQQYIKKMEGEIAKALPSVITPERFTRIVLSAVSTNPKLAECTPQSFMGAMMQAAQLGMECNTPLGQGYLIPRWNSKKGVNECQFQLGYLGMKRLAENGGVKQVQAHVVYTNDEFEYELGLNPDLKHKPAKNNRGEPEYIYATYHTNDGGYGFEVMSIDDIRDHAKKYSEAVKNSKFSPWTSNFLEMGKKTVLKRLLKYAPLSTEAQKQFTADETIKNTISENMFDEPAEYIDITDMWEETDEEAVEDTASKEA